MEHGTQFFDLWTALADATSSGGLGEFPLIGTIAVGFTAAWVFGLLTQWLRLSPIVGYLIAGVLLGPRTPGFDADPHLAHQLAEIGVILLMFGVGLHFHIEDLLAVKWIAIPGALGQSLAATGVSMGLFLLFDMPLNTGAVLGMAMAVASTVVLMRVLMDADALSSPAGHVAVGWLLVEDVLTVIVLVIIPVLGNGGSGAEGAAAANPLVAIGIALLKLVALVAVVIVVGSRVVPWVLMQVARLRSRELFTLTVMVFSIAIAAGAYVMFGASMALGAFLAGMLVAQSPVSHQAAADALPLRDAFAVLFFVSVGMLFDPMFLVQEPLMMLAALVVIFIVKPLVALIIVAALGHSVRTALTVALGLAQIGEFSFILSNVAREHGVLPDSDGIPHPGHSLLVGAAILSITVNPILFRSLDSIENWLKRRPRLWALLNSRAERRLQEANTSVAGLVATEVSRRKVAVVVGFGPVGRTVDRLLRDAGLNTVVIDMNMDTVAEIRRQGQTAIFGDASREAILESAGVQHASHLVLTLPQSTNRAAIVAAARNLNGKLRIFVRARYLREREDLEQVGATAAIFEEAEAAVALARLVLVDTGAGHEVIESTVRDIRTRLILDNVNSMRVQTVRGIMVPWQRVMRLSNAVKLDEVRRHVSEKHFSRWPVVDERTAQPIGYLLVKDLIGLAGDAAWTSLIRPLSVVKPEDDVESTLLQFQREGTTLCLVQDRHKPVGIVTIEDILEQVIGRIEDEYPQYPIIDLRQLFLTDESLLNLSSQTAVDAIAELAAKIPEEQLPRHVDITGLAVAREREIPTNIGAGVAIPHARCPNLKSPVVVVGRSLQGIVFDGQESEPVHIVFLLLTPAEQPDLQVLLLSQIANVAANAETLRALRSASTAAEFREILSGADFTHSTLKF